jgi:hypothetical protein
VRVTHAYTYFLQEWGYQAWNLPTASPIDICVVQRTTHVAIQRSTVGYAGIAAVRI